MLYICIVTIEDKAKYVNQNKFQGLAFQVHKSTGLAYRTCRKYEDNPFLKTSKCFLFVNAAYDRIKEAIK